MENPTPKERESKSAKAGLQFPVSRFQRNLRKGHYADRIGTAGAVFLTAAIEYLSAEILELAGSAAKDNKRVRITPRHIMMAIKKDAELNELLGGAFFSGSGVMPFVHPVLRNISKKGKKATLNDSLDRESESDAGDDSDDDGADANFNGKASSQNF